MKEREKRKIKREPAILPLVKSYKDKYKRKNMISICLNDDEYLKIEKITSALNVPRATATREILILNADVVLSKIKKSDNKSLLLELNKIGNNLNQITKKINSNIDLFLKEEGEAFALSFDQLNETFKDILKKV
ncbi:plasmid mobilization relaxosome protein MobC [Raoultella ornithinolytica]|uniref:plasmid mobilization relaxosome protein MobC n=1 Tax=Raoultella ornithinolytica TaxID=54291 RepID=UPI00234FCAF0|nr:plasmid mobilization relaxosome protein MobC [Raoultella ornithinolytica]ELM8169193.1 plasmid mobilization relaxosome protein MobC [Escherichia coli]ELM8202568.1 plasmid mobilization relaxosome protein MobC [Escherichia coli]MDC7945210.1 MobC family plasmid mobilization relaxosome protein [Raoultella ornithinolytica]